MTRWSLAMVFLLAPVVPVRAEEPAPSGAERQPSLATLDPGPAPTPFSTVILQDPFSTLKGENGDAEKDRGGAARFKPAHIRDNALLVEEAFNQETGVAQHIFNWVYLLDRNPDGRTRDFAFVYTMELPIGSQRHQFSFTPQFLTSVERPSGGPAVQQGDIGDTFLNYRYQLLADDDFLWAAPRFTLILPTGDKSLGTGTGKLGYQFNLPVSRYGDPFDFHFNVGVTYTPGVSVPLSAGAAAPIEGLPGSGGLPTDLPPASSSAPHDLLGYNLGGSVFWKPRTYLNFFVEVLALWNAEIDEVGLRVRTTQVFVNPGFRYAVCQFEEVEWVIGLAAPVGLTRDTPDIGIFAYMSIEHAFRKGNGGGK